MKKLVWNSTPKKLRSWHWPHHFIANRWEKSGSSDRFYFLGHQNHSTFHDCSHGIHRHLLLGRKAMTNLDSILKSRDITLPTNVCVQLFETPWTAACKASLPSLSPTKVYIVKAVVFSSSHVWMWELDHKEGWALKNDAFELWCWRRLLRVPWTARKSNQSILKEINPDYSLEVLMLQLQWFATWWEELTHGKRAWCWERLKAKGQAEDVIVKWHHQISGYEFEQTPGGREGQGSLAYCSPWRHKELDTT